MPNCSQTPINRQDPSAAAGCRDVFIIGSNVIGQKAANKPFRFGTFDEAKRHIIACVKREEYRQGTENKAEALCHFAEELNLESKEFSRPCLGTQYWIARAGE